MTTHVNADKKKWVIACNEDGTVMHLCPVDEGLFLSTGQPLVDISDNPFDYINSVAELTVADYPFWDDLIGEKVYPDEIVDYDDVLFLVIQEHTIQADWTPESAPALYARYYKPDEVPEWQQPQGAHDTFPKHFRCTRNGKFWRSLTDNNVLVPGVAGWREYTNDGTVPAWIQPSGAVDAYQIGEIATHGNQTWINESPNNSYEPGVFGWVLYEEPQEPPVEPPANQCNSIAVWDDNEDYTQMEVGQLRKVLVNGVWKVYAVKDLGFVHYDPSGPNGHYGWTYQYDCPN